MASCQALYFFDGVHIHCCGHGFLWFRFSGLKRSHHLWEPSLLAMALYPATDFFGWCTYPLLRSRLLMVSLLQRVTLEEPQSNQKALPLHSVPR